MKHKILLDKHGSMAYNIYGDCLKTMTEENTTIEGMGKASIIPPPKLNMEKSNLDFSKSNLFEEKGVTINSFLSESKEIELEKITNGEIECKTDIVPSIKRRILIGLNTYGKHNLAQIAAYCNLPRSVIEGEIKKDPWYEEELEKGTVPCLTKAEIISRLCVEAETASKATERILAITKLMEYRGVSAPEGGSRNFCRTVMRFKKTS